MAKIKIVQVRQAGQLEQVEREIPEPGINQVRIKVKACGVCHSDMFTKEGLKKGFGPAYSFPEFLVMKLRELSIKPARVLATGKRVSVLV